MTGSNTPRANSMTGKRLRRWPLRPVSAVILLVLAAVAVASCLITRNVVADQERLILREQTAEVAATVGSGFAGAQSSLQLLGEIARSNKDHPQPKLFAAEARTVTTASTQGWLVTTQSGTSLRVTASAGNGPAVGQAVSGELGQLGRRALSVKGMASGLVRDDGTLRLAFALGGAAGPGTVVWQESAISPTTPTPTGPTSPWHSLNVAIYLSNHPDPSALVVTTTKDLPLAGVQYPFRVGADTWLIVASSPQPAVGSLGQDVPWIVLGFGAVIAVLMTAVLETLGQRRDYASALVEERTVSLPSAIAEREAAQADLSRQENMAAIGQLATTVGHELRNPLAVVMNVLYLMKVGSKTAADDPMHRHLATAEREISAATLIVSDLLDYAAGRGPILAPVEIGDLVAEALSVAPPPDGVQVIQRGEPQVVDVDRDQIRQALLNLITNGYDSMPGGGMLTVSTTSVPGSVQITVTDTGMGMDEQTRYSIFTPFFTKKTRGIGLGLAVTKRVVEAHGGTIAVQSKAAVGSSFSLTLPVLAAMASAPQ
jgi:signal transduction histidine kinase